MMLGMSHAGSERSQNTRNPPFQLGKEKIETCRRDDQPGLKPAVVFSIANKPFVDGRAMLCGVRIDKRVGGCMSPVRFP
jgi:hypothetical protein